MSFLDWVTTVPATEMTAKTDSVQNDPPANASGETKENEAEEPSGEEVTTQEGVSSEQDKHKFLEFLLEHF